MCFILHVTTSETGIKLFQSDVDDGWNNFEIILVHMYITTTLKQYQSGKREMLKKIPRSVVSAADDVVNEFPRCPARRPEVDQSGPLIDVST